MKIRKTWHHQNGPLHSVNYNLINPVQYFFTVDTWTVAFSPDSRYIATGSHAGKISLIGVESGKKESALDTRGKFTMSIAYVCYYGFFFVISLPVHTPHTCLHPNRAPQKLQWPAKVAVYSTQANWLLRENVHTFLWVGWAGKEVVAGYLKFFFD